MTCHKCSFITVLLACFSLASPNAQVIPVQDNFEVVETVRGDLDGDAVNELVVAYNTNIDGESQNVARQLVIYRSEDGAWCPWVTSDQALRSSLGGGMMGDPDLGLNIEDGKLSIYHSGGARHKWSELDTYELHDGKFQLVNYTSVYGYNCGFWESNNFDLATGGIKASREVETCAGDGGPVSVSNVMETYRKSGIIITLQQRHAVKHRFVSPEHGIELVLSGGLD